MLEYSLVESITENPSLIECLTLVLKHLLDADQLHL